MKLISESIVNYFIYDSKTILYHHLTVSVALFTVYPSTINIRGPPKVRLVAFAFPPVSW